MPRLHGFREPAVIKRVFEFEFASWLHKLRFDLAYGEINGLTRAQLDALDLASTWALFLAHERYDECLRRGYGADVPIGKQAPAGLPAPAITRVVDLTDTTVDWSQQIPTARVLRRRDRSAV